LKTRILARAIDRALTALRFTVFKRRARDVVLTEKRARCSANSSSSACGTSLEILRQLVPPLLKCEA